MPLYLTLMILGILTTRLAVEVGLSVGLVDRPDSRKQHKGAVPLVGGIAIFFSLFVSSVLLDIPPYSYSMMAIATAVFAVGVVDDMRHIRASLRLTLQFAAGVGLATWGGIAIVDVGNLLAMGNIPLLMLTVPLTALAVAGLSNAYNMIDGIDGLAASTAALPFLVLFFLAAQAGHPMAGTLLSMLIPVGVFLLFNLGPNSYSMPKIFLGDAGSLTLGFLVTASLVYFSQGEAAIIRPVTALWLVTVPLMDMLATMARRIKRGLPLMQADRSHLHHALMDMGLTPRLTLLVLLGWAAVASFIGLSLEAAPESFSLLCYFLLFFGHCLFVMKSELVGSTIRGLLKPECELPETAQ
jgi:UDP-GlcNAc:undecaprenyl-phosphate/decaprenyl-phosphate GlcNAc-1-phosphate transferase